jgi:hypothetical protein
MPFNKHDVQGGIIATTYGGEGRFNPAFRERAVGITYYWPNIVFKTEEEAVAWARQSIDDAFEATAKVMNQWNVYPV